MSLILIFIVIGGFITLFLYLRTLKVDKKSEDLIILNQRIEYLAETVKGLNQEVGARLKEQRESVERSTHNVFKQVQGFTSGMTSLIENVKQVQESVKNVSSFQDIFKSPKLRGIWGEMSLEASLAQYFSKDNYKVQHYFKSGEAVDVVLKLPNSLLLPIDSKFNWENLDKMNNAKDEESRQGYQKVFFNDVKKKIDEIASKYILPPEGTVDMALMYIPAETVYYELISNTKLMDIPDYARRKRVALTSPNTFMSHVSAIQHWIKDIQLSKQTKEIRKNLERISLDGNKLSDDFRKLGNHLGNAQGSYANTEKRLSLMVDRVQNVIETGEDVEDTPSLIDTDSKNS